MNIRTLPLYVFARACPAAAMLVIALTIEKRFGSLIYGEFSVLFTLCLSAAAFFFGWIGQAVSRFSNGVDDLLRRAPQAFLMSWGISSILVILVALVVLCFRTQATVALSVATVVCTQGLHLIAIAMHQARFKSSLYFGLEAFRAICITVLTIGLGTFINNGIGGLILGLSAAMLVDVCVAWISIRKYLSSEKPLYAEILEKVKEIFRYGWPISVWLSISLAIPFIDRVVLKWLGGGVEMGEYAYQYDIVFRSFTFVLLPITISMQPALFKAYADKNFEKIDSLMKSAVSMQLLLAAGFAAILYCAIFYVLPLGKIFLHVDKSIFVVLCVSAFFWQIALVSHKLLECEKQILLMVSILAASYFLLDLGVAACLFKWLGLPGFAIGSVVGGLGYSLVALGVGNKNLNFKRLTNFPGC